MTKSELFVKYVQRKGYIYKGESSNKPVNIDRYAKNTFNQKSR